jgi:hypothetical protein
MVRTSDGCRSGVGCPGIVGTRASKVGNGGWVSRIWERLHGLSPLGERRERDKDAPILDDQAWQLRHSQRGRCIKNVAGVLLKARGRCSQRGDMEILDQRQPPRRR